MICRNEMLLPVVWGKEQCRCRVVPTVSEELQGEEVMSRSTFPKIQLNRKCRPGALTRPHNDKVDRKSAQHTFMGQSFADPLSIRADHPGVFEICGKRAPQVALPARAAQHLVVGGQELYFSEGCDSQLNARTAQLKAGYALFDDATPLGELCSIGAERSAWQLESHFLHATCGVLPFTRRPGNGQVVQVNQRVTLAGHAFVKFNQCLGDIGSRCPQTYQRVDNILD